MQDEALTCGTITVPVNVEYPHSTLVTHTLLRDANHLIIILVERDALHSSGELPAEQAFARLDRPEPHSIVCRSADEEARLGCRV